LLLLFLLKLGSDLKIVEKQASLIIKHQKAWGQLNARASQLYNTLVEKASDNTPIRLNFTL
jgi:hypothetical protein